MGKLINWLHISDIHFHPGTEWRDGQVRDDLLTYLKDIFDTDHAARPDLIFCTGDIALGASTKTPLAEQYALAKVFFDDLLKTCGGADAPLAIDRLFLVPGNHDVNRLAIDGDAQQTLINMAKDSATHEAAINRRFEDQPLPFKNAIKRLDEYAHFIKTTLPHQHDPDGRCFYARTLTINGIKLGIAGFNSAWSCAGPEDDRHVWLAAEWQFNRAAAALKGADIRVGLIHHPIDWLTKADSDVATPRIASGFDFWLHGHIHSTWVTPTGKTHVQIAAGAVGAETKDEFGVNLLRLDDQTGGAAHLHHYEHGWVKKTVAHQAQDAVWFFDLPQHLRTLAASPSASAQGTVAQQQSTARAGAGTDSDNSQQQTLYGRDALLKQCQQHLQKKSIFLLYGMRGNGKTALIQELEQRAPLRGKEGLRIAARPDTTADDLFQDLAPLLGDRSDFPRAPDGDAKTIAAELVTRYKKPAPAWLWIDRAHCLLDQNGFRQAALRQLLLGLNLAYGADFVIVMELRERPPLGFLREHAESCEVPGLDRASMGEFLAAGAPEGADWRYGGDQLRRVYNWLGTGNGKQANPLTIRLLIEVARGHAETPVQTLERHSDDLSKQIDEQLLDDLIGKLLNREERGLIEALAMYRTAIPHDHVEMLENKLQLPNAWAGLDRRCLVATNNKQNEYYLHGFIASWLLTRLGYQEQGDEEQGQFQPGADAAQREYAENKHAAIAACWLHQLAGSKRKTRLNIERALEAFHHLVAARQADRVAEVAVALLTGRREWALQRIKALTDYLHKSGAPVKLQRQALQYWVALDPDEPKAQRFLGECWIKEEGRASPKALACFENACRLSPDFPQCLANLGRCLLAQGVDGARDFLQRLPGVERAHPEAINDYVEAIRADCLKLCGDDEQASALRMKKIGEGSGHATFYNDEARARLAKHDIDGAIAILTLADTRGCADDVTVAVLSGALERAGRGGEAAALREKRMVGGSRNPAFYSDAAQARLLAGDADGALAILDLAEKNQCGDDFTLAIRATALERAGRGTEAAALREKQMAGGSRNPAFYNDAAQARLLAGDADGALAILDLAEKNHAGNDFTLAIRATVLERAGRGTEAAALREKQMASGSRNPVFYNDAAQARLLAGDAKGALAILDLAQANGCANAVTENIRARALRA